MHGSISYDAGMNDDEHKHFDLTNKKFNKKEEAHMYGDLPDKAIPSDAKILSSTLKFQ